MDGLENFINSPQVLYTAAAVGGVVAGAIGGYLLSRVSLKNRMELARMEHETHANKQETRRAEYALETAKVKLETARETTSVEREGLAYENADATHKRELELMERKRQYGVEDARRAHERELELETKKAETKIAVAEKLAELRPALEQYIAQLTEPAQTNGAVDSDYMAARDKYRGELVAELEKTITGNVSGILDYSPSEARDAQRSINILVDTKYPLPQREHPPVPEEIRGLVTLLLK